MPLDIVQRSFSNGTSAAIERFDIDMPVAPGKICMIRQVQFLLIDFTRLSEYDISWGMSMDPDHAPASLIAADSRMFLVGRFSREVGTFVGFQVLNPNPQVYQFPEGIPCPYSRLPFFVQHSNTNSNVCNYRVAVLFTFEKVSKAELAIAVVRRGRGGNP